MYFDDTLNHSGVDHEWARQIDITAR